MYTIFVAKVSLGAILGGAKNQDPRGVLAMKAVRGLCATHMWPKSPIAPFCFQRQFLRSIAFRHTCSQKVIMHGTIPKRLVTRFW